MKARNLKILRLLQNANPLQTSNTSDFTFKVKLLFILLLTNILLLSCYTYYQLQTKNKKIYNQYVLLDYILYLNQTNSQKHGYGQDHDENSKIFESSPMSDSLTLLEHDLENVQKSDMEENSLFKKQHHVERYELEEACKNIYEPFRKSHCDSGGKHGIHAAAATDLSSSYYDTTNIILPCPNQTIQYPSTLILDEKSMPSWRINTQDKIAICDTVGDDQTAQDVIDLVSDLDFRRVFLKEEAGEILSHFYRKLLIIRHPFERVYYFWEEELKLVDEKIDVGIVEKYGAAVERVWYSRSSSSSRPARTKTHYCDFETFLHAILELKAENLSNKIMPISRACYICALRSEIDDFEFIADFNEITKMRIEHFKLHRDKIHGEEAGEKILAVKDDSVVKEAFKKLHEKDALLIPKLFQLYKWDFRIFRYGLEGYV